MSTRREAITVIGGLLVWAEVRAQQGAPAPLVGFISALPEAYPGHALFRRRLRELGHIEGENLRFEPRYAGGAADKLAAFAAELAQQSPLVLAIVGAVTLEAVRKVNDTVSVVFTVVIDPVDGGLVPNAQHPGGRTTGVTNYDPAQPVAQMQLMKQLVHDLGSVAILHDVRVPSDALVRANLAAATFEGLRPVPIGLAGTGEDLDAVFAKISEQGCGAVLALEQPAVGLHGNAIVERANAARLPSVFPADGTRFNPMINFGSSFVAATGRMADLVDKVLKGARPGDIPIEVVKEHRLVVNRRVARTVGVEIPTALLARADSVIY